MSLVEESRPPGVSTCTIRNWAPSSIAVSMPRDRNFAAVGWIAYARRRAGWVVLAGFVGYYLFMGSGKLIFVRYALPLLARLYDQEDRPWQRLSRSTGGWSRYIRSRPISGPGWGKCNSRWGRTRRPWLAIPRPWRANPTIR